MTMREIKFRARRMDDTIHNGNWVYGHYFTPPLTDENSGMPAESGWFFLSGGERRHCIERDGVVFTVDPETVGEFTGLKDENGTEIYEDDILDHTGETVFFDGRKTGHIDTTLRQVKWVEDSWGTKVLKSSVMVAGCESKGLTVSAEYSKVIGNIYENADLAGV